MTENHHPFVVGKYYSDHESKQRFLRDIFDRTAPYYEGIAYWGWFCSGDTYRKNVLKRTGLTRDMRIIDVASGTGQMARAILSIIADPARLVCVEPSIGMIEESRKTVPAEHIQSTAEHLSVDSENFDFLTMAFALRHVDDLEATFNEFRRVLKGGGKALIVDVTLPENKFGLFLFRLYFKHILPGLTLIFSRNREAYLLMKYYWDTMEQMTDRENVAEIMRKAGFSEVRHRIMLGCFSEYEAVR